MKVVVVGAGVVGLSSALLLARDGHSVTVMDAAERAGTVASWRNGAFLDPALYQSWAAPELFSVALKSFVKVPGGESKPGPVGVSREVLLSTSFWLWGGRFLVACLPWNSAENGRHVRALTFHSLRCLDRLGLDIGGAATRGTLEVFDSPQQREMVQGTARVRDMTADDKLAMLPAAEVAEREPGLAEHVTQHGAYHSRTGRSGDVYVLTQHLKRLCEGSGVAVRFETAVERLERRPGAQEAATAVLDTGERVEADAFVLAAGINTPALAATVGVPLPIMPVRGYVLSVPLSDPKALQHNIYAGGHALVAPVVRTGRLWANVSGCAEFVGRSMEPDPERLAHLRRTASELFRPGFLKVDDSVHVHVCHRCLPPDDVPVLGASRRAPNVYINAAHGSKGFSMALGCADLLAAMVGGREPAIDVEPFSPDRWWF